MPKGYKHLTYEQRCQIYAFLKSGFSHIKIAEFLEVDQSTISREIARNKGKRGYRYKQAQRKAESRRSQASRSCKKMTPELVLYVEHMMKEKQWSPEQISGRMKKVMDTSVSHERIYQYIWQDKREGGNLYKQLRCGGKKYNKRGNAQSGRGLIPGRIGIEHRPTIVETKERVGDFEIDTIVGARHRGAIVSIVDRKTKITRLVALSRMTAEQTSHAVCGALYGIKEYVHTLTADNGKEFAYHDKIAQNLQTTVYFANPYHAWERGLNENTNRLIRQYFPKNADLSKITYEEIQYVEYLLNSRPRKTLGYRSPFEVFLKLTGKNLAYALRG